MTGIDPTNPADDSLVSAYPANERASRAALVSIIGAEHDDETGRHKFPEGDESTRDGITNWEKNSLFWNTESGTLQRQTQASSPFAWDDLTFPSGTKMLFLQETAPPGWTQDNTVNDRVLRVIDNSGTGAAAGGSWTLSGLTNGNTGSTTLTVNQIPSHKHGPGDGSGASFFRGHASGGSFQNSAGNPDHNEPLFAETGATGGGQGHDHSGSTISSDGNWRPAYVNAIVAVKD